MTNTTYHSLYFFSRINELKAIKVSLFSFVSHHFQATKQSSKQENQTFTNRT
jgi:hypothetical protein